ARQSSPGRIHESEPYFGTVSHVAHERLGQQGERGPERLAGSLRSEANDCVKVTVSYGTVHGVENLEVCSVPACLAVASGFGPKLPRFFGGTEHPPNMLAHEVVIPAPCDGHEAAAHGDLGAVAKEGHPSIRVVLV